MHRYFNLHVKGKNILIYHLYNKLYLVTNITQETVPEQKSEAVVKMSLSKNRDIGGFDFSKVKLTTENENSTDYDKKNIPSKVKDIQDLPIPTPSIPDLDFLAPTIPFICLFLVLMAICLLNILKTSLLSSTRTEQSQIKCLEVSCPNINIIEHSSVVAAHGHDVNGDSDSEFMYLAHA